MRLEAADSVWSASDSPGTTVRELLRSLVVILAGSEGPGRPAARRSSASSPSPLEVRPRRATSVSPLSVGTRRPSAAGTLAARPWFLREEVICAVCSRERPSRACRCSGLSQGQSARRSRPRLSAASGAPTAYSGGYRAPARVEDLCRRRPRRWRAATPSKDTLSVASTRFVLHVGSILAGDPRTERRQAES